MDRRAFLATLRIMFAAGLTRWAIGADAQPSAKKARLGILSGTFSPLEIWGLLQPLADLGYVEGQNVVLEHRTAAGHDDRLPALAADLVRRQVEVIVAVGLEATQAARQATRSIPIVFLVGGDPVALGLVPALGRPGGNLTGITTLSETLAPKRLELLKVAVPGAGRVAVLWNPASPEKTLEWQAVQAAARTLGIELHSREVRVASDLEPAVRTAAASSHALLVLDDGLTSSNRTAIVELVARHRLPAIYEWTTTEIGMLMVYGPSNLDLHPQVAAKIHRILQGARPGALPVEQATRFQLVVNLGTAKALGLVIPPAILLRADRVIE